MTDKQPEALMLADALEDGSYICDQAAAELRRLHEVNDALVQALQEAVNGMGGSYLTWAGKAKIALAKAEGK